MKSYLKNLVDANLIATISVLIVLCIIFTMLFSKVLPSFKQSFKSKFAPYIVILMLIYGLITFIGNNKLFVNFYQVFIFFQIATLALGIIHVSLYRSHFHEFEETNIWKEAFFTFLVALYALIPFYLVYGFLNGMDYTFIMSGHILVFMVPTWFNMTFNKSITIPSKILMAWEFPKKLQAYKDLSDDEMKNSVVLSFNISKNINNDDYLLLKAKSPKSSTVGRVFYHLIHDYNEEPGNEKNAIETNNLADPYSWVFFLKDKWYMPLKQINPEVTLFANNIEDNSQILCYKKLKSRKNSSNLGENVKIRDLNLNDKGNKTVKGKEDIQEKK